jgi:hypothetical protein
MAKKAKKSKKSAKTAGRAAKAKPLRAMKTPARRPKAPARRAVAHDPIQRGVELMNWTHALTTMLLADWPHDKLTHQSSQYDNHALWTMGHLSTTYSWLASLLDGHMTPLPESYNTLFGMGSKPGADASIYPPMGEVRHNFDSTYQRFIDLASKINPADAHKPTVANSHGFAKDRVDVLVKAAWHEGWHSGQLSTLRRCLGLKGVM